MIDLRSEVIAPPTEEMWTAMQAAPLGWASMGEDETVNRLEALGASLLGKEAAVWVPTCGLANLVALLAQARPGDSVVLAHESHVLTSEGMWITAIAGLLPVEIATVDGRPDAATLEEAIASTAASVVILENTHTRAGGTVLDAEVTNDLCVAAHRHGARVHLDGARLANAAAALNVSLAVLVAPVETVALSLNKGLCAPMGTLLAGPTGTIADARDHLKRLGGGTIHKAGILAAAAIVALETMPHRLVDDHRRARQLGERLVQLEGVCLDPDQVETNVVLADVSATGLEAPAFAAALVAHGVRVLVRDARRVRLVTHRLIGDVEVQHAVAAFEAVVATSRERTAASADFEDHPDALRTRQSL